jgi:hypothetical protein
MNDELLLLANTWPVEQLDAYIKQLEERVISTGNLISDLKKIRRTKLKKKLPDNGQRGG